MSQGNAFDPGRQLLEANPLQAHPLVQLPGLESIGLPTAYTQRNRSGSKAAAADRKRRRKELGLTQGGSFA